MVWYYFGSRYHSYVPLSLFFSLYPSSAVLSSLHQRLLPTVQTVGKTEEFPQVQSFDKVDMAFAVRDQSRQRRTLLMLRMFSFLIE